MKILSIYTTISNNSPRDGGALIFRRFRWFLVFSPLLRLFLVRAFTHSRNQFLIFVLVFSLSAFYPSKVLPLKTYSSRSSFISKLPLSFLGLLWQALFWHLRYLGHFSRGLPNQSILIFVITLARSKSLLFK